MNEARVEFSTMRKIMERGEKEFSTVVMRMREEHPKSMIGLPLLLKEWRELREEHHG